MDRVERRLGWVTQNTQRYEGHQQEDWAAAVRTGMCPFCGSGPFVVVASHVHAIHGIDRGQLREMCGFLQKDSICDQAYSASISPRLKDLGLKSIARSKPQSAPAGSPVRRRQARRNHLTAARRTRKRDESILALYVAGLSPQGIALKLKIQRVQTVREVLQRNGVKIRRDLRPIYGPPKPRALKPKKLRAIPLWTGNCPECGRWFAVRQSVVNRNAKSAPPSGYAGPFCSRECGHKYTGRRLAEARQALRDSGELA